MLPSGHINYYIHSKTGVQVKPQLQPKGREGGGGFLTEFLLTSTLKNYTIPHYVERD